MIQQSGPKDDPYLQRPAFRISIRMSVMGVYSVRSPTEGKVIKQWLESTPAFGMKRRSLAIQVRTDEGDEVVTVLRSGRGLRRLRSTLDSGQRVGQGQRFGFIFLGATIDVYLPASSKILVGQGEQVKSGSSLLASLTRH